MTNKITDIDFKEEDHSYTVKTENGKEFKPLSVTTIIGKMLNTYEEVPASQLVKAAERGTKIHDMLEKYITTRQRPDLPPSFTRIALDGFDDIAEDIELTPIMAEEAVAYMDEDGTPLYAGKFDLLAYTRYGLTIIDYKTTAQLHKEELALQLTAYKVALEQMHPAMKIVKAICIHLPKAGWPKAYPVPLLTDSEVLDDFREIVKAEAAPQADDFDDFFL